MGKKHKSSNYSKGFAIVSLIQFIIVLLYAMTSVWFGYDSSMLSYLIPTSGGMAALAVGFYFNKAKTENLSKQRIRYVYLKMLLQDKLSPEAYAEIEEEITHIDDIINNKLSYNLQQAIDEDNNETI